MRERTLLIQSSSATLRPLSVDFLFLVQMDYLARSPTSSNCAAWGAPSARLPVLTTRLKYSTQLLALWTRWSNAFLRGQSNGRGFVCRQGVHVQ
jgi:hypothetical protein